MAERKNHIWIYRGRRLRQLEWGLWKDLDRTGYFFLHYRPRGRNGPCIRRWAYADGVHLTLDQLQDHVRFVRAAINQRKLGMPVRRAARPALESYIAELNRQNLSTAHVRDVRRTVTRFLDDTRIVALDQASAATLERFLRHVLAQGRSPRTLNKHRALLSGWFTWAIRHAYMEKNPALAIPPAKQDRRLKPFPMPKEMIALVEACSPYEGALWTLLALTGLRRGSFLSLTADCFQRDGILVPKTKRRAEWWMAYGDCPLWTPRLGQVGRRIWAERPPTLDHFRNHLDRACKVAEVRRFTPHGFRHAFCSWLSMMGESYQDIAAWAHHTSTTTVEGWYAHLRPHGRSRQDSNRRRVRVMCSHCLRHAMEKG